jgi:type II secretion system protein H
MITASRGFTLIELMVVALLLSILTVLIVPQFSGTHQGVLLRAAAREVLSAAQLAQSQAVTLGRPHRLRIEPARGAYLVEAETEEEDVFRPVEGVPGAEGRIDPRIAIEVRGPGEMGPGEGAEARRKRPSGRPDETDAIPFHPDGTSRAREVLLTDREGHAIALRIDPVTSRVRLESLSEGSPRP